MANRRVKTSNTGAKQKPSYDGKRKALQVIADGYGSHEFPKGLSMLGILSIRLQPDGARQPSPARKKGGTP